MTRRTPPRSRRRLSHDQEAALGAFWMVVGEGSWEEVVEQVFGSLAAAEAAWREHGERLTAEHIEQYPGGRPPGWWAWSAPERLADPDYSGSMYPPAKGTRFNQPATAAEERDLLLRWGVLSDEERRYLARYDRADFEAIEGGHSDDV